MQQIYKKLAIENKVTVNNISEDSLCLFLYQLLSLHSSGVVLISSDDAIYQKVMRNIKFFDDNIKIFDIKSEDISGDKNISYSPEFSACKISGLYSLSLLSKAQIAVIDTNTVYNPHLPVEMVTNCINLVVNDKYSFGDIIEYLVNSGYTRVETVYGVSEFAVKGGILDLYNADGFFRIVFNINIIESIRIVDVETQKSLDFRQELTLLPATDILLNQDNIATFKQKYGNHGDLDTMYHLVCQGRHGIGIEKYLDMLYPKCSQITDYISNDAIIVYGGPSSAEIEVKFNGYKRVCLTNIFL